jgi:uncharacterized protein DUF6893
MAVVGVVATVIAGLLVAVVGVFAVRSIPDWSRYRRLRKM